MGIARAEMSESYYRHRLKKADDMDGSLVGSRLPINRFSKVLRNWMGAG